MKSNLSDLCITGRRSNAAHLSQGAHFTVTAPYLLLPVGDSALGQEVIFVVLIISYYAQETYNGVSYIY